LGRADTQVCPYDLGYVTVGWKVMRTLKEQYIVDSQGKRTGVILTIKHWEQLTEDLHDLAVVAERRDEEVISLEEMKRRLNADVLTRRDS
jgi:hypothetical protein